jgi:hypothetical protein
MYNGKSRYIHHRHNTIKDFHILVHQMKYSKILLMKDHLYE